MHTVWAGWDSNQWSNPSDLWSRENRGNRLDRRMMKTRWHRLNPWDPCQIDLRGRWGRWFLATLCFRFDPSGPFDQVCPKPPEDRCYQLNLWDPFGRWGRFDLGVPLRQFRWDPWDRLCLFGRFCLGRQLLNCQQHLWDLWVQWVL